MEKIIKENIIKNVLLAVLLITLYFPIQNYLIKISTVVDQSIIGDVLVFVSIIAVTACFGNFAFTYEKLKHKIIIQRYLAHFVTGILMLLIGLSLIFSAMLIYILIGHFILIDIILLLLYLACVGYDFWDLLRIEI